MLPKLSRLSKQDIEISLLGKSRRYETAHFSVMAAKNKAFLGPKVSVTCSKKVCPKAVDRTSHRRRGYAAVASLMPELSKDTGILVLYRKNAKKEPLENLRLELREAFSHLKLI
jgi:RNase P protein component